MVYLVIFCLLWEYHLNKNKDLVSLVVHYISTTSSSVYYTVGVQKILTVGGMSLFYYQRLQANTIFCLDYYSSLLTFHFPLLLLLPPVHFHRQPMWSSRTVSQLVLSLAGGSPVSPLWMNCPLYIPSTSSHFLSSSLQTRKLSCYLLEYINGILPTLGLSTCWSSSWNILFQSLPGWPLLLKLTSLFKCHLLQEALSVLDGFFILHWPCKKKSFFVAPVYNFVLYFCILSFLPMLAH